MAYATLLLRLHVCLFVDHILDRMGPARIPTEALSARDCHSRDRRPRGQEGRLISMGMGMAHTTGTDRTGLC